MQRVIYTCVYYSHKSVCGIKFITCRHFSRSLLTYTLMYITNLNRKPEQLQCHVLVLQVQHFWPYFSYKRKSYASAWEKMSVQSIQKYKGLASHKFTGACKGQFTLDAKRTVLPETKTGPLTGWMGFVRQLHRILVSLLRYRYIRQ